MSRFLKWFFNLKPRNTVYGFTAIAARHEILDVRRRHGQLLEGCRKGTATYADVDANIARLSEIEGRYFG